MLARGRISQTNRPVRTEGGFTVHGMKPMAIVELFVGNNKARREIAHKLSRLGLELNPVQVLARMGTATLDLPIWGKKEGEGTLDSVELSDASVIGAEVWGSPDGLEAFASLWFVNDFYAPVSVRVPFQGAGAGPEKVRPNANPGRMARVATGRDKELEKLIPARIERAAANAADIPLDVPQYEPDSSLPELPKAPTPNGGDGWVGG